jgi:hypothetical protein
MSCLFTKETISIVGLPIFNTLQKNGVFTHMYNSSENEEMKKETLQKTKCDEKYKHYLEIKYVECLKKSYIKKELMVNKCDLYVKEYIKCFSTGSYNEC